MRGISNATGATSTWELATFETEWLNDSRAQEYLVALPRSSRLVPRKPLLVLGEGKPSPAQSSISTKFQFILQYILYSPLLSPPEPHKQAFANAPSACPFGVLRPRGRG